MDGQIFIRLRHRIKTGIDQLIYLEDIAQITGDEFAVQKLSKMPVYHVSKKDRHIAVLDIMHVVKTIKKRGRISTFKPSAALKLLLKLIQANASFLPFYLCLYGSYYLSERPLPL